MNSRRIWIWGEWSGFPSAITGILRSLPGKIRIRLFAREDTVVFAVEDNGRGADDARIAQMNESLGDVSPFIGTHNGVRNVHERIGLVFGSGYGLTFRRSEWGGVAAFISIPKTMEAEKPAP